VRRRSKNFAHSLREQENEKKTESRATSWDDSGPAGRCHQVVRDQYSVFNMGEEMRSYMLLVPSTPANGTIPQRVMTLLNYVTPTTAGNPATVRMPPQSGPNLGNPQIKRMPLTADQIAQIRMWAMTGAKFE
jgi:hypothetical protein